MNSRVVLMGVALTVQIHFSFAKTVLSKCPTSFIKMVQQTKFLKFKKKMYLGDIRYTDMVIAELFIMMAI